MRIAKPGWLHGYVVMMDSSNGWQGCVLRIGSLPSRFRRQTAHSSSPGLRLLVARTRWALNQDVLKLFDGLWVDYFI